MKTDRTDDLGLPDELAARLQRLAEAETDGTRPFPRVDTAIRRTRITRYGGVALAGVVAAAVIAVEVLTGGAFDRADRQGVPSAPTPSVTSTQEPSTPQEAGFSTTETGGSLGDDQAWLKELREEFHRSDKWRGSQEPVIATDDILVLATGDVEDRMRYAVLLYSWPKKGETYWDRAVLTGPAGADAADLGIPSAWGVPDRPDQVPDETESLFQSLNASDTQKAVAIIVAPGATEARIETSRTFAVQNGTEKISTQTRGLPAVGTGVWVGPVTEAEYRLSRGSVRIGGALTPVGSGSTVAPGLDLAAVAAPGTDPSDLEDLNGVLGNAAVSTAEVPVWAAAVEPDGNSTVATVLLRSIGGVYVVGLAETRPSPEEDPTGRWIQGGHMVTTADDDGHVMAGIWLNADTVRRYLVLAPENATRVRIGDVTATVKNRLAVVDVPQELRSDDEDTGTDDAEALAADGSVIARITPLKAQQPVLLDSTGIASTGDGTDVRP